MSQEKPKKYDLAVYHGVDLPDKPLRARFIKGLETLRNISVEHNKRFPTYAIEHIRQHGAKDFSSLTARWAIEHLSDLYPNIGKEIRSELRYFQSAGGLVADDVKRRIIEKKVAHQLLQASWLLSGAVPLLDEKRFPAPIDKEIFEKLGIERKDAEQNMELVSEVFEKHMPIFFKKIVADFCREFGVGQPPALR